MIGHSSQGVRETTFGDATTSASPPRCGHAAGHGLRQALPRLTGGHPFPQDAPPESSVPCTIRLIGGVGVAVPPGMEHLYADLDDLVCETCGGSGLQPGEHQPDADGNYTPCGPCEGTGVKDPH